MKKFLYYLLLVCFSNVLFAQNAYRFRNYTISDGLSQSSVLNIIQDRTNALWVGTQDGLNRFDGKNFEIFISENTPGIENDYIRCSAKTKDGNIWFGTANGLTVYEIEKETFKTYHFAKNTIFQIENIAVDQQDNLWITSPGIGLTKFDSKAKRFKSYTNKFPSNRIHSSIFIGNNNLLVNTEDKGVFQLNIKTGKVSHIHIPFIKPTVGVVNKMTQPAKGIVLFCTNQGIFQYEIAKQFISQKFKRFYQIYGSTPITDIHVYEENKWILTSTEGLFTILPNGQIIHNTEDIFQKNALPNNKITCIIQDQLGTYWLGNDRGLSCFNPKKQDFLGVGPSGNLTQGLPSPTVWCFAEDKSSKFLYIGTDEGVSVYDKSKHLFQHYSVKNKNNQNIPIRCVYVFSPSKLLLGTDEGLYELNINGTASFSQKIDYLKGLQALTHNRIYTIVHWKEQAYFIGTKGGVILYDFKTKNSQIFEHAARSKSAIGSCRLIFKNKAGHFYFATSTGGMYTFKEKNNSILIYPYSFNAQLKNLSKDYITSAYEIHPNEYYFGTLGSGLVHWNESTQKGQVFKKDEGLPNNVVYSVIPDEKENIWLSTNKGLSCFKITNNNFINYQEINGLMSNEFNLGAYLKSTTGVLYFGGIYGYNYFNPKSLINHKDELKVIFSKFRLDDQWLKPNEKGSPLVQPLSETKYIDLSYKQRTFTIQFIPNDISNPELINFKYILIGSDEEEILIRNTNEIHFASLSPGEYVLKVYSRIGEGKWSETPSLLHINIANPFWWSWWFVLIVIGTVFVIVRVIIRQKVELERKKLVQLELKIAERTREIRAKNAQIEAQNLIIEEEKNKVVAQSKLLQIEKEKTERLIRKIIPEDTVKTLKAHGTVGARTFDNVSVLFTDFVGFTRKSENLEAPVLVEKLDFFFKRFDEITIGNNLEKIKTIGDAYMSAGGVPLRNKTNAIDAVLAAIQIQDFIKSYNKQQIDSGNENDVWDLRIGINSGPVVAGMIGTERLAYDIWGSTVNRAQQMETLCEPGKVTITDTTYQIIKPYFECTFRGITRSKTKKVEIQMYTVERIKPQLSLDEKGTRPNDRFFQILNLYLYSSINYNNAEKYIIDKLTKELSPKLHYHSVEHMKDVVKAVENIALLENVTDEGLFLLKSAASYHDAGFIEQYDKNEPIGARMAEEILPTFGYTKEHIEQIKELIYVTQIPHQPKNKLEEIMCDADLDYLGRDDFHEIADKLRRELREHGKIDSDRKWDEIQVNFLTHHRYFTETSIKTRRPKKLQNLEDIKKRLEENNYKD